MKPWILFYKQIFKNYSPDQIILTLNRIMKSIDTPQNTHFNIIAKKIFKKLTILLSLQYEDIQSMISTTTFSRDKRSENLNVKKEGTVHILEH